MTVQTINGCCRSRGRDNDTSSVGPQVMARKSLQDLSGIASTIARSGTRSKKSTAMSNAPALGALQGSLSAIREIDPDLIDDWGPLDRLDEFTAVNTEDDSDGFDALKTSIMEDGQQVPILVRRTGTEGRFESIYGRRRLKVCRELGIKVRANVQDIDDATALLAKGLENTARRTCPSMKKHALLLQFKAPDTIRLLPARCLTYRHLVSLT